MSDSVVETIVRAEVIQQLVDQALTISNETILRIGNDGISTTVVDPANVATLFIKLGAAAFESVPNGTFAAGTNLERLDDYLDRATGDDPVAFAFDPETRRMELRHNNREFQVALIDPDSMRNEPDDTDVDLPNSFQLPAGQIVPAIEDAEMVGTGGRNGAAISIISDADAGELLIKGEGDTDEFTATFDAEDFGDDTTLAESFESLYSSEYLTGNEGLLTALPNGVDLNVAYGEEFPIEMSYDFPDAADCHVEMMLAPRITS